MICQGNSTQNTFRRNVVLLVGLYLLPLAANIALWLQSTDNPFFLRQISDDKFFLDAAARMASGQDFGPYPYFVNPGYLLFLTLLTKLSLGSVTAIRVVQILVGSWTPVLAFLTGRRLFGTFTGLAAWLLCFGYGPLGAATIMMESAWLEAFLVAVLAWILSGVLGTRRLALAGLAVGLLALSRPTALLFALLVPPVILLLRRREGRGHGAAVRPILAFLVACWLPILPVTWRNYRAGHELVLIASHGGINFFIGNSPEGGGTFYPPQGMEPGLESINLKDPGRLASAEAGRALSPAQVSRFWFHKGLNFLVSEPLKALTLYARKTLLLFHTHEVSLNSDYYLLRDGAPILWLFIIPFSLLTVAGAIGLVQVLRRHREADLLSVLLVTQVLGTVVFFISSRYRLPLAVPLAIFGGLALQDARQAVVRRSRRAAACVAIALLATTLLTLPYPLTQNLKRDSRASFYEMLGISYINAGDTARAEAAFRTAVEIQPAVQNPHWYLAQILEGRGDIQAAREEWWLTAKAFGPDSPWGQRAAERYEHLRTKDRP